jgi:hypothetical protein
MTAADYGKGLFNPGRAVGLDPASSAGRGGVRMTEELCERAVLPGRKLIGAVKN